MHNRYISEEAPSRHLSSTKAMKGKLVIRGAGIWEMVTVAFP